MLLFLSLCANALGKGIYVISSTFRYKYIVGKTVFFLVLARQPVLEKENIEFKPGVLFVKIYLVSHPACYRGVGRYIHGVGIN